MKYYPKIPSRFSRVSFDTEKLNWKYSEVFAPLSFIPNKEDFGLSGFSFSLLVDIHDWTEAKHDCKPFSTAAVPWCKGNIQLAVISIEVARDSVFTDHAAQWTGIEREKQRTQNGPLGDSEFEIGFGGQTATFLDPLASTSQRFKPVECLPNNPKPITESTQ